MYFIYFLCISTILLVSFVLSLYVWQRIKNEYKFNLYLFMTTQLFLSKGECDYLGNIATEDRYIVIDENGNDAFGEHFPLDTVNELIKQL